MFNSTVAKLELIGSKGDIQNSGSGIFYAHYTSERSASGYIKSLACFLTCKHVLEGDPKYYRLSVQTNSQPFLKIHEIDFNISDVIKIEHPDLDIALLYLPKIELLMGYDGNISPAFVGYQGKYKGITHNFLTENYLPFYNSVDIKLKINTMEYGEDIFTLGFHLGDYHRNRNFENSIYLKGISASYPLSGTLFIMQAKVNKGSSGSPVFITKPDGTVWFLGVISEGLSQNISHNICSVISSYNIFLLINLLMQDLRNKKRI